MRLLAAALISIALLARAAAQHAPNATLDPTDLAEFSAQPPRVQELITAALALTKRNLGYTFGSDDPARGGMDCSGTISYVLRAHGWKDVPRDSPSQYAWTRTAGGAFHEVASKSADSAEFAGLRPGDLLFWSGTYNTGRSGVAVSHVMLYLGTETTTHQRVMFGASDGRSYHGVQRFGVSVFDFKMPRPDQVKTDFLGYARIPSLGNGSPATAGTTAEETPKTSSGKKRSQARSSKSETNPKHGE